MELWIIFWTFPTLIFYLTGNLSAGGCFTNQIEPLILILNLTQSQITHALQFYHCYAFYFLI